MPIKRKLYIIGASGFGRELESWLQDLRDDSIRIAGYLDADPDALVDYPSDYSVMGDPDKFAFDGDDLAVFAIADPRIKQRLYKHLESTVEFLTFIHPSARIGKNVKIGTGSVICPDCILTTHIHIGRCVTLNCRTIVGHDVAIGPFSSTMTGVMINGKCRIEELVYFGCGAVIPPSKTVARGARVGIGSVVVKNVKPETTIFGNPGKVLRVE